MLFPRLFGHGCRKPEQRFPFRVSFKFSSLKFLVYKLINCYFLLIEGAAIIPIKQGKKRAAYVKI